MTPDRAALLDRMARAGCNTVVHAPHGYEYMMAGPTLEKVMRRAAEAMLDVVERPDAEPSRGLFTLRQTDPEEVGLPGQFIYPIPGAGGDLKKEVFDVGEETVDGNADGAGELQRADRAARDLG